MADRLTPERLGTWWWNRRFSLGMWIGGFTEARRAYGDDPVPTEEPPSEKPLSLLAGAYCDSAERMAGE